MKSYLLLLAVFLSMAACNQNPKQEKSDQPKMVNMKVSELATAKDLNCGMDLANGSIADTTTYEGKVYGFCSTECKAEFLKDPQAHLTQK